MASAPNWRIGSIGVTTLPLLFDIFLRSGSSTHPEMAASVHGSASNSKCDRTMVENSQVRMISNACGPQVHREHPGEEIGVVLPPGGDLGGERRRGPRVHHVGIGDEAARLAPLVLAVAVGDVAGGVDGQARLVGHQRVVVVDLAVGIERVPERERHAEVALAADQPVGVETLDPAARSGCACARDATAARGHVRGTRRAAPGRAHRCGCTTGGTTRSRAAGRRARRTSPGA